MNSDPSKLRQQQEQAEQTASANFQSQEQSAHEFKSVEEMIRFDAGQTVPPEELAERIKETIAHEPAARLPWWRRLFGK